MTAAQLVPYLLGFASSLIVLLIKANVRCRHCDEAAAAVAEANGQREGYKAAHATMKEALVWERKYLTDLVNRSLVKQGVLVVNQPDADARTIPIDAEAQHLERVLKEGGAVHGE